MDQRAYYLKVGRCPECGHDYELIQSLSKSWSRQIDLLWEGVKSGCAYCWRCRGQWYRPEYQIDISWQATLCQRKPMESWHSYTESHPRKWITWQRLFGNTSKLRCDVRCRNDPVRHILHSWSTWQVCDKLESSFCSRRCLSCHDSVFHEPSRWNLLSAPPFA